MSLYHDFNECDGCGGSLLGEQVCGGMGGKRTTRCRCWDTDMQKTAHAFLELSKYLKVYMKPEEDK